MKAAGVRLAAREAARAKPPGAARRLLVALLLAAAGASPATAGTTFTPAEIAAWSERSFEGQTAYRLVEVDGEAAVHARCEKSASALYLERRIDLRETPILEWRWRIRGTYGEDVDETTRGGDDYPARIYAVKAGRWRVWRTRAVNYVWASGQPAGARWPNAYARQAGMLAVDSGDTKAGRWVTRRRNLRDDFEVLHGERPERIDGLAIMTDCDDLGADTEAWYGTIRLLPE
jgi:hypothetical protein